MPDLHLVLVIISFVLLAHVVHDAYVILYTGNNGKRRDQASVDRGFAPAQTSVMVFLPIRYNEEMIQHPSMTCE